jgi:hypothetical protein
MVNAIVLVRHDAKAYTVLWVWQHGAYKFFDPAPVCHR